MRNILAAVGGFTIIAMLALIAYAVVEEVRDRRARRRRSQRQPCPHLRETLDADRARMEWRCLDCGTRHAFGIAYFTGSNKRSRRPA